MGHVIGHLKDISKAGAQDNVTCSGVLLLLGNEAILVKADGLVLLVERAGVCQAITMDPGVEQEAPEADPLG